MPRRPRPRDTVDSRSSTSRTGVGDAAASVSGERDGIVGRGRVAARERQRQADDDSIASTRAAMLEDPRDVAAALVRGRSRRGSRAGRPGRSGRRRCGPCPRRCRARTPCRIGYHRHGRVAIGLERRRIGGRRRCRRPARGRPCRRRRRRARLPRAWRVRRRWRRRARAASLVATITAGLPPTSAAEATTAAASAEPCAHAGDERAQVVCRAERRRRSRRRRVTSPTRGGGRGERRDAVGEGRGLELLRSSSRPP